MYIFLIVALPLGFLLLTILLFPKKENVATRRAFLRGLIAAIPVWGLARLLGAIMPSFWGSPLLAFHEWFDRFLPYALLPALAYPIFYRYHERIPAGESQRRLTAFYAGALSLSGLAEALRVWGHPGAYPVIILPIDLKSGFAGEILQKFSNYRMKLAIIGDFSEIKSKSLRDFIRESNNRRTISFVSSIEEALFILDK